MVLEARVYAPDREAGEGRARKHWSVTCDKRGLLRKIFLCPEGLGFDLTIKRSRAPLPPLPSHTHDPLLVPQLVRMWLQANHATFIGDIVAPGLNTWGQTTKVWIFSLIIWCALKEKLGTSNAVPVASSFQNKVIKIMLIFVEPLLTSQYLHKGANCR